MKIQSLIALTAVLSQIVGPTMNSAMAETQVSGALRIKQIITSAKEAAQVLNYTDEQAYTKLTADIASAHVTSTDAISFISQYGSTDEQQVFSEAFSQRGATPEQMAVAFKTIATNNVVKGADFKVSCGLGLGIGIPLVLAGIITGIVYLSDANKANDIKTSYINQRNVATREYLSSKGDLDVKLASANKQIAVDQASIDELNRKINSNFYGQDDIQKFYAQIATLKTDMVAQQNISGGTNAQQQSLTAQYNNQMQTYSEREVTEIQSAKDSNNQLPFIAIPSLIIGIPFLLAASDC